MLESVRPKTKLYVKCVLCYVMLCYAMVIRSWVSRG